MKKFFFICLSAATIGTKAQSLSSHVVSSGGSFLSGASGSLSSTIGQSLVGSLTKTNGVLFQGFQVPGISIVTAVVSEDLVLHVYPNPASESLFISGGEMSDLRFDLVDMSGKIIHVEQTKTAQAVELNLKELAPAPFVLKIQRKQGPSQAVLIIKSN